MYVDDTLGIFHTHMVAGFLGGFMTGILATVEGCAAFGLTNPGGAIEGNGRQVWVQIVGALFVIGWNMAWTSIILLGIKYILRVPLRFSDSTLTIGDDAIHGEAAYTFDTTPLMHDHDHHHRVGLGHHLHSGHHQESPGSGSGAQDKEGDYHPTEVREVHAEPV